MPANHYTRPPLAENIAQKLKRVENIIRNEEYIKGTFKSKFTVQSNLLKPAKISAKNIEAIIEETKQILTICFTSNLNKLEKSNATVLKRALKLGEICPSLILLKEMAVSDRAINKQIKKIMKLEIRLTTNVIKCRKRINAMTLNTVLEIGKYMQRLRIEAANEIRKFSYFLKQLAKDKSVKGLNQRRIPYKGHIKYLTMCVARWTRIVKIIRQLLDTSNQSDKTQRKGKM